MLRTLLLFLFGVVFGRIEAASCPYSAVQSYNRYECYTVSGIATTWESAESVCQYLGGDLVSIESDEENDYFSRVVRAPSLPELYIGAYVGGGTWEWINRNATFSYANFKGQVTVDPGDVAAMMLTAANFGLWKILSATYFPISLPFACQVPDCLHASSERKIPESLSTVSYSDGTTTYYYFGSPAKMMVYRDAEEQCMKIGGHLPSISNAFQNAAVQDAAIKLLGKNTGGKLILGYSNLMMYGFTWSDGNPSWYTNWAPGEPVTVVPGVAWMDVLTGVWNTAAPTAASNFICELPSIPISC